MTGTRLGALKFVASTELLASLLYLCVVLLTVGYTAFKISWFNDAAILVLVSYIAIEWPRIPSIQKKIGVGLIIIGTSAGLLSHDVMYALRAGLQRTLPFLLIFASVSWLQLASSQSPALLAIREAALRQPPGRRFFSVAMIAHFLGAAFNLAGMVLLTPIITRDVTPALQKRLGQAMMRGFGACTCWSPFIVGTVVIVEAVPGVSWMEVWPPGFLLAALLLFCAWAADRLFSGAEIEQDRPAMNLPLTPTVWFRVVWILVSLFVCVFVLVEGMQWSIPIALVVTAPGYTLLWTWLIARKGAGDGPTTTASKAITGYSSLRAETFLFAGANIMGMGISPLLPQEVIAEFFNSLGVAPALVIAVVMLLSGSLSALGIHPLVSVVLITSVLSPDMIGVPPAVLALALMVMWGQGTTISPVSATTLFVSRTLGIPSWVAGWHWNGIYIFFTTLIVASALAAMVAIGVL